MVKSTFNRKEIKYRLDPSQLSRLWTAVEAQLPLDEFGTSLVSSIYLDTSERSIIDRSLEKPLYKEKLRVRWYDAERLEDASYAFLELKKKYKGIVYKRRLQVSPEQANAFLCGRFTSDQTQVARELDAAWVRAGELAPSALITCERTSFGTDDDEGALRITFDEFVNAFGLFVGEGSMSLLEAGEAIMEVKCLTAYPSWLVDALSSVQAYPSSFSKYGTFYRRTAHA